MNESWEERRDGIQVQTKFPTAANQMLGESTKSTTIPADTERLFQPKIFVFPFRARSRIADSLADRPSVAYALVLTNILLTAGSNICYLLGSTTILLTINSVIC